MVNMLVAKARKSSEKKDGRNLADTRFFLQNPFLQRYAFNFWEERMQILYEWCYHILSTCENDGHRNWVIRKAHLRAVSKQELADISLEREELPELKLSTCKPWLERNYVWISAVNGGCCRTVGSSAKIWNDSSACFPRPAGQVYNLLQQGEYCK